jgi:hypothetical protein
MRITYLRDTSPTHNTCPTLYATDQDTYIVQGKLIFDAGVVRSFNLLPDEAIVEVPAGLLAEVAETVTFPRPDTAPGLGPALMRAIPHGARTPSISTTSNDSFIVMGIKVTDPGALAAMDIPEDETAVEVPRELLSEISADAA